MGDEHFGKFCCKQALGFAITWSKVKSVTKGNDPLKKEALQALYHALQSAHTYACRILQYGKSHMAIGKEQNVRRNIFVICKSWSRLKALACI